MPNKIIGELNIAMALALLPEELSATFTGKDLPQAIRLREKYTPWLAEYGRQMHGFPYALTSKWNGHVDSVGFLVGVDTAAQVDCFDEAEFKSWLSQEYKLAVKEVLSANSVALIDENYSEGNVSPTESSTYNWIEQGDRLGSESVAQDEMPSHHQSLADSEEVNPAQDVGTQRPGNLMSCDRISLENVLQEGRFPQLSEELINQLNRMKKCNQISDWNERVDIVESITPGVLIEQGEERILVEGSDLHMRIRLGESLEGLEFIKTDEIAIRVKTIWPSPNAMIALARPSGNPGTSCAELTNLADEEDY